MAERYHSVKAIEAIVNAYNEVKGDYAKCELLARLNSSTEIPLDADDFIKLIGYIERASTEYAWNIINEAFIFMEKNDWTNMDINTYVELIGIALKKEYFMPLVLFDANVIKHRNKEEIHEILKFRDKYSPVSRYFEDRDMLEYMTWEEQRTLFMEFRLDIASNFSNFCGAKKKIMQSIKENTKEPASCSTVSQDSISLYTLLRDSLSRLEDKIRIEEYMNSCNNIQEFIAGVTPLYNDDETLEDENREIRVLAMKNVKVSDYSETRSSIYNCIACTENTKDNNHKLTLK